MQAQALRAGAAAVADLEVEVDEEASGRYERERALENIVTSLAPLPFVLLPFTLLIGSLFREGIDAGRLGWWIITAVLSTAVILMSLFMYYRRDTGRAVTRWTVVLLGASFACLGLVFGMASWVAAPSSVEVTVLFTLFPATASAVGVIVTAGRRDMYLAFLVPLALMSAGGLLYSGDTRLHGLAVVALFYVVLLLVLHHSISKSAVNAIRLQWQSDQLVRQLAHDRVELTGVNDQLAATNTRLAHQATHDPLTGLSNRRGTLDDLDRLLAQASDDRPVGLLFLDLDRFKAVNDALGHRGGDRFISIIADRLSRSIEVGCMAGRMGGDEFVIMLPGLDQAATIAVANRLVGVLAQPVHAEGREMPSSVSIGVASAPRHGRTSSELLRHANAALYRAKAAGRNRVELFDGTMQVELLTRLEDEQGLRRAIDDGEIVPFFQPEIDATNGHVVGAELLARWVRSDGRVAVAQEFLQTAINAGLLERITERVLAGARPHIRRLAMLGLPDGFRFRVNAAPGSTERSWRENPIDQLVQGLDPMLLTIDVREVAVTSDLPTAAANLASFRARGGRVCLDDFAKGVSSLSLLRRLPLDEVRIDRASIDTITAHPHDRAIVRSIISLVREVGLVVTAEGVETGAQADALIALGCVRQQGHLYAPALPAVEFESFLLNRMAERYAQVQTGSTTWETRELASES